MNRRRFGEVFLRGLGAAVLVPEGLQLLGGVGGGGLPGPTAADGPGSPEPGLDLRVDADRLNGTLRELSRFGRTPEGGVSRVAFSDADLEGRAYVMELMREAGLEVRVDEAGNILGRTPGQVEGLPPLMLGSHIDSVPEGGNYDGNVGTLGAVEVARTLREAGHVTRHPLEVVAFSNEEGGKTGSRAMAGLVRPAELELVTASGYTIGEGLRRIGGDPERLERARRVPGSIAGYLELHVEQGAVLERTGTRIGVVEGIVGIRRWRATVRGEANHAGTTPMDQRRDAMLGAARLVEAVHRVVTDRPGSQVGTVGRIEARPGAPNVIPGEVVLTVEIRDLSMEVIQELFEAVLEEARRIGEETGTEIGLEEFYLSEAAPTDERFRGWVEEEAAALGLSRRRMPSGAGHDAQSVAHLAPIGMIFVPSRGGISHSPREYTAPEDVEAGANVLLRTLLRADAELR